MKITLRVYINYYTQPSLHINWRKISGDKYQASVHCKKPFEVI